MLMTTVISELDNTGCHKPPVGSFCTRVEPVGTNFPDHHALSCQSSVTAFAVPYGAGQRAAAGVMDKSWFINPVKYSVPMVQLAHERQPDQSSEKNTDNEPCWSEEL